ncbi:MAG: hypothetical protein HQM07_09360, partial [Zetaproteobacteria bacterium]|nr:hypothetical protein [Zetaproteobacteria bacterium]
MGHTVYLRFGIVTRLILQVGGEVFGREPGSGLLAIRHHTNIHENYQYQLDCSFKQFQFIEEKITDRELTIIDRYMQHRAAANIPDGEPEIYINFLREKGDVRLYSQEQIYESLPNLNKKIPTVLIMAHVFSDVPHCHGFMIYDDYYTWLTETLNIIKHIKNVHWIIKAHPADGYYNPKKNAAADSALKIIKSSKNIFLAPKDALSSSFFKCVNGVVTVRGTAGLEFACQGLPILCTGTSVYSGKGFTIDATTTKMYKEQLKSFFHTPLSKEQQRKAKVCAYYYFFILKTKTNFLPVTEFHWFMEYNVQKILSESIKNLEDMDIYRDPLYINFHAMRAMNHSQLFNIVDTPALAT